MRILNTTNLLLSGYYRPIILYVQDGEMSSSDQLIFTAVIIIASVVTVMHAKTFTGNMWERKEARKRFLIAAIIGSISILLLTSLLN